MKNQKKNIDQLQKEYDELKIQYEEAKQTIDAILSGEIDALVVSKEGDEKIYTLQGADYTYRVIIEEMKEGVITLDSEGVILYSNMQFAEMMKAPLERIIGSSIYEFISTLESRMFERLFHKAEKGFGRAEITFLSEDRTEVAIALSLTNLRHQNVNEFCAILTDITERKIAEKKLKEAHANLEKKVEERTKELVKANTDLRSEIKERKIIEKKLASSLKEKEAMIREIHHRVKNNLQIISSLLNLQSKYIKDPMIEEIFMESHNRIRSMAMIHEKLYQPKDFSKIDFKQYVNELTANLFNSYKASHKNIRMYVDINDIYLSMDTAILSGLIINEVISNSLKYAFPVDGKFEKKEITIALSQKDEKNYILKISDTGIGFPTDYNADLNDSLGVQLVSIFTEQLDGTLSFNGNGKAEYEIIFPIPPEEDILFH